MRTIASLGWAALLAFFLALGSRAAEAPALAWQSSNPIIPPDFEAYFPDDPEGAEKLKAQRMHLDGTTSPEELLRIVRHGLRRAESRVANEWVKWVGQQLVFGPQNPRAIELIYHASANPAYRYSALYFGLSRVNDKSPAILRRLVEIAMASDDWANEINHAAWASGKHQAQVLEHLRPYLATTDPEVKEKAEVLRAIFLGELTAHEHSRKIRTEHAIANFGDKMDALRERLQGEDDRERRETLRTIAQNSLTLIMDDSWLDAYEAAAADSDRRVRQEVVRQVAGRWASSAPGAESMPAKAFALLLKLSRDENREVRSSVNQALRPLKSNEIAQARVREMEIEETEAFLVKAREYALQAIEARQFDRVESMLHEIRPGAKEGVDEPLRQRVTAFVQEIEKRVAEAQWPDNPLQERIDSAGEGAVVELGEGTFSGPVLITKAITLRGTGADKTIVSHQGDEPAIFIRGAKGVRLEKLGVRWSPSTPKAKIDHPAAVAARDASVVLQGVALEPIEQATETPYGLMAAGDGEVEFVEGRSRGFAYALIWLDGANGKVADSDLRGAGHSVVTIHPRSQVEVAGNILADCAYHAVRVTGGTVDMHDNIVMGCNRAGAYLGNKDAHGRIYNNLFTGNRGEIWGYYRSDVLIERNVFYRSNDPALIFWNTCDLVARGNSFTANPAAVRQYLQIADPAEIGIRLEGNHYWKNQEKIQPGHRIGGEAAQDDRFQLAEAEAADALEGDPKFRDPSAGDFSPLEGSALVRNGRPVAGLTDPEIIRKLAQAHNVRITPPPLPEPTE